MSSSLLSDEYTSIRSNFGVASTTTVDTSQPNASSSSQQQPQPSQLPQPSLPQLRRVEVNQRALIDKILARYASASAVYRELLQNSNDANATTAEIHFITNTASTSSGASGSSTIAGAGTSTGATASTTTIASTTVTTSKKKNTNNTPMLVSQVIYRNNGSVFAESDWERLQKIAEGNPDVNKVGAFGVGAYTMFSICEQPMIVSGTTSLQFVWQGDALYTQRIELPAPAKKAASATTATGEPSPWTSFYLPSRDLYAMPDLYEFGTFLTAALTFTQSLRHVRVTINNRDCLSITKSILSPPQPLSTGTAATASSAVSATKSILSTSSKAAAAFLWNSLITSSTTTTSSSSSALTLPSSATTTTTNNNAKKSITAATTATKLFALQSVQESLVAVTVRVYNNDDTDGESSSAVSSVAQMEARYISAIAKTQIPSDMRMRMERVTKKPPPPSLSVHIFLNDRIPTATMVGTDDDDDDDDDKNGITTTTTKKEQATSTNKSKNKNDALALQIAQSFAPIPGQGRIFIGFRTSQTTGLGAHVAAPFVPTVEREAMDLQDPVLSLYNTELLQFAGMVLRLTLEHCMRNIIDVAWQASAPEREALEEKLRHEEEDLKRQQQQQLSSSNHNNRKTPSQIQDDKKKNGGEQTDGMDDDNDDDETSTTAISTGFMSFAMYMARGVKKKIVSVAKSAVETLWDGDAVYDALLHPVDPRPLSVEEQQAVVLMSSYCPQQSTPDPAVGTALANGFSKCMPNSAPPVLTRSGVRPGNEARLPHYGMEQFVSDSVIRTVVFQNAEEYHTVVARCRKLQWDDLISVIGATVLEQHHAVKLIQWWTRYCRVEGLPRSTIQELGSQLKESIRYYPATSTTTNGASVETSKLDNTTTSTSQRPMVNLREYHFFTEANSPFAQRDVPLPETVIPGPFQDAIGTTIMMSDTLLDVWFNPLPMEIFAEFICRHDCLNAARPEDELLRIKVLSILCRDYVRRQEPDRAVFGGLCWGLLSRRRCLPFDSDIPTPFAADFPSELYLYSAELKAFDGVGSFHKVSASLQAAGVTDEFLLKLGVRKSVSIDFLFTHMDTLSWSQNPKALIEYLRTATLTRSDLTKLSTTKYLPAANDTSTTYAPGELYLPSKDLHILPFVKVLAWPEPEVSESSDNGKFLNRLGMKTSPPLAQVLLYLSDDSVQHDQRLAVLDFVCDRLVHKGAYYMSYNSMSMTEKKKYRFLPCVEKDPFEAGKLSQSRHSPVTCFSDATCSVMGFPILDPALGKQAKIYGALFQCEAEPAAGLLLNQLAHLVALGKDKVTRANGSDSIEENRRIEAALHDVFKYLSHRSADLNYASLEPFARESFIPSFTDGQITWFKPDEVFFKRTNRGSETLTEELFHVIEFSPFLAAVGVKEEATTRDLFQKMLQSPDDVLKRLGSEKKYRSLLRRIAADPPFPVTRPAAFIRDSPFLLAYTLKPFSEEKSEKSEPGVEDKATYHLAKASDIYVIDNSNFGRMFPVYRAPPETDLEDFYVRLGSRYISKSVERRFEVVGSPRANTELTIALRDRLRERGPLLVSPNITSRPLVAGAASILDDSRLEFFEATNLLAVYTLDKTSRRSRTTCFSRPNGKKNSIYITADFDLFDAGQAIGDLILKRCQLEDAFFISSLLETPLDQLRARGFPVDRIIKPEPMVVPEEPKPRPTYAAAGPTIAPIPAAKSERATTVPVETRAPPPANKTESTDSTSELPVKSAGASKQQDSQPPAPTGSKADILLQMFPDADPKFVQAALGANPSVDDVRELADKMASGHYPKNSESDTNGSVASTTDSSEQTGDGMSKKKSLRHRLGRALGGKRGINIGSMPMPQLPPILPGQSIGNGGNGQFVPPGSTNAVENRGPVSPAADAQSHTNLERMLQRSVGTSNRVQKNDIDAPETNLTSIPPDLDRGQTCEVIPGHSLKPFLGPRGNGLTHNGIMVFSSKEHTMSEAFLMENESSLRHFADVLERLCSDVFGLQLSTVAIYHDPAGVSIAFNRNRALHFNFRFFHGLHWLQNKHMTGECYAYWYVTICHELAHHLVSGHTKEHGFYCESFSQMYLPKLMKLLRALDIE